MRSSSNVKKSTCPMKVGWPQQILYDDEVANVCKIDQNNAYYMLSKRYMNHTIVLNMHDLAKYEKQVLENE